MLDDDIVTKLATLTKCCLQLPGKAVVFKCVIFNYDAEPFEYRLSLRLISKRRYSGEIFFKGFGAATLK